MEESQIMYTLDEAIELAITKSQTAKMIGNTSFYAIYKIIYLEDQNYDVIFMASSDFKPDFPISQSNPENKYQGDQPDPPSVYWDPRIVMIYWKGERVDS